MRLIISEDKNSMAVAAASAGARRIREAIEQNGRALIALTTGRSQQGMLARLVRTPDIAWDKVEAFQMDEFVGLPSDHYSSTRSFLSRHVLNKFTLGAFHAINGMASDPQEEARRYSDLLGGRHLDVAFLCVGDNGHLAFNDPPANLTTRQPYIVVDLNERGRKQQVNEGWFDRLAEVPEKGITMSIHEILKSRNIITTVPGIEKARGVAMTLFDDFSPSSPCAALRLHPQCSLYVDRQSAQLVYGDMRDQS